ncbi:MULTISPECIES: DUF4760 domain-containing protein [unclassified Bradyrhizobium]|uniref:DUF4760 domain-containing protein n=1 Tax=unclassified Bradyrhizobium TaxID=2631580 RepID=UPI0028E902A7|nr:MULTISPECIES: DUF4760 domain-containing protein [unclassified Bradyrhizobium]
MDWLTTQEAQNIGLWLQSGAIFLSFIGVIISAGAIRSVARRRAMLDLIMAEQSNEFLIAERKKFIALRDAGHLVKWADPAQAGSAETFTIRTILNRYELIAIGIKERTLDKRVYREYARTTVVKDWTAVKPFVVQMRQTTQTPTYYCEFEKLARAWANHSETPHC